MGKGLQAIFCIIGLFICFQMVSCSQKVKHSAQEVRAEMAKIR